VSGISETKANKIYLLFDVSKTKANDAFNYWILRDILPASQMEEVGTDEAKYQNYVNHYWDMN